MGRRIVVVLGDAVVFVLFAWIGRGSHHETTGSGALTEVLGTAAPFLIGWFVGAPLLGAYRQSSLASPRAALARTALAWALAGPLGLVLRALLLRRGIPPSFAVIALLFNLILLLLWRGTAASLPRRAGRAGEVGVR